MISEDEWFPSYVFLVYGSGARFKMTVSPRPSLTSETFYKNSSKSDISVKNVASNN